MALLLQNPPLQLGDPPTLSSTTPNTNISSNGKTWAQVTVSRVRQSLLHKNSERNKDSSTPSIIQTHHWKRGRYHGSMFFDVGAANITHLQSMQLIKEQYPTRIGVVATGQGSRRLVEVNFDKDDSNYLRAIKEGLLVKSTNTTILPCEALDSNQADLKLVRLSLTHLPLMSESKLLDVLKNNLEKYGAIIDIGIIKEPTTQTFMGTGYAVLNRSNEVELAPLTHNIRWDENWDDFHATWIDMPKWCRYCHTEGHVVGECQQLLQRTACYNCKQTGHKAAMCPHGNYGKRQRKLPSNSNEWVEPSVTKQSTVAQPPSVTTIPVSTSNSFDALTNEDVWEEAVEQAPQQPSDTAESPYDKDIMDMIQEAGLDDDLNPLHARDTVDLTYDNRERDSTMEFDGTTDMEEGNQPVEQQDQSIRTTISMNGQETSVSTIHQAAVTLAKAKAKASKKTIASPSRIQPVRNVGRPAKYND